MNADEQNQAAVRLLATRVLADRVKAAETSTKAELDGALSEGSKLTGIVHFDGRKITLGSVSKASPKPKAMIVNGREFNDYLLVKHGDDAKRRIEIDPNDYAEIAAILEDHGHSDLFHVVEFVPAHVEAEELRAAEEGKQIPGVEVQQRAPYLSARTSKTADEDVAELIRGGFLDVAALALEAS